MIEIKELRKSYTTGGFVNHALDGVNLTFRDNEFVAVLGPSGSGKTTLLNVLGGLDRADSGDIVINGTSTKSYKASDWDTYRNHRIGFIFQSYNLIPHQSVLANVELALTLANVGRAERQRRAKEMLVKVGLGEHISKKPNQLSGGQMQRVAIARALVNDPDIVLADEPTGALDTETGIQVMDLLSEVAKDRLVVMVTHNPDLANTYATRIVNFADGKVVGDSDPILAAAAAESGGAGDALASGRSAEAASFGPSRPQHAPDSPSLTGVEQARGEHAASGRREASHERAGSGGFAGRQNVAKDKKASMGFLTALSLSFNNLMTKKGRTFLTAFAGSIGIIGIAAILALSNGVNAYIADTEEEALTAYPLTITKSSFDLANLMTGMAGYASTDDESGADGTAAQARLIPQSTIMTDMFAKVKNNDLVTFKGFLEDGGNGIWNYVNDIEYDYGIKPLVYKADTSKGLVKLNPSYMSSVFQNGLNTSSFMSMGSGMSTFQEMLADRKLMESSMEVVQGRWPEKYDEAVLVLSRHGKISDYTLYSLGVMDPKAMEDMTKQALNGEDVEVPDEHVDFSYDDAMKLHFKVVPAALTYQRNNEQGTWTDMSKDTKFMRDIINGNAIDMKIVGIVKAREDANTVMFSEGIAYPKELTLRLMQVAAESAIVKEQKANRDVDVFTGKTFDELQDDQGTDFDLSNVFSVDEEALRNAFSFDTSAFEGLSGMDLDLSGMKLDPGSMSIDPDKLDIDDSSLSSVFDEDTMRKMMQGAPAFKMDDFELGDMASDMDEAQQQAIAEKANSLGAGFMAWMMSDPSRMAELAAGGTDPASGVSDSMAQAAAQALEAAKAQAQAAAAAQQQAEAAAAEAEAAAEAAEQAEAAGKEVTPSAAELREAAEQAATAAQQAAQAAAAAQQQVDAIQAQVDAAQQGAGQGQQGGDGSAQQGTASLFQQYLAEDEQAQKDVQELMQLATEGASASLQGAIAGAMQAYMTEFVEYFSGQIQGLMLQAGKAMAISMAQAMAGQMAEVTKSMGSTISQAISGQLGQQMQGISDALQDGFAVDADAFANAIHFNMSQDDLTSLLTNFMNADELTYDANLSKLGYASEDNPESISIYSKDFPAKEAVLDIIDGYNDDVSKDGDDSEAIQYSDIAGVLMSSVTDIVDTISLVLIAFVSISLVVSSIMIAIVTYISVLERKKEIGVLRAMGASKGNVANVFNAETIIEGLIAGVFAIAVVLAASVPVNKIIWETQEVPNVMQLPPDAAAALIGISVLLTFVAGLIPSQKAAHADPVEALRSE